MSLSDLALTGRASRLRLLVVAVLVGLVGLACAETVRVKSTQALRGRQLSPRMVAMTPFAPTPYLDDGDLRDDATDLVTRYLTDALSARGLAVVPASDSAQALSAEKVEPRSAAVTLHARFGADTLVVGSVTRFRERKGESLGVESPASVGFRVELYSAPEGELLWSGHFEETQLPLSANVLKTTRYPGRGTRWLTAEEFARWGAEEVVRSMPLAP